MVEPQPEESLRFVSYEDFAKTANPKWSIGRTKFEWNRLVVDKASQAIHAVQYALVRDKQSFIKEGADDVLPDIDMKRLPTRRQDTSKNPFA